MTIVSVKIEAGGEINRIELSDGSLFSFRNCYLPREYPIVEGRTISEEEEEGFRFAASCLRAEKAALRLIARAEQCSAGLARKLEQRKHKSSCANAVVSRLLELNLINDMRFATLWLESRLRFSRSPRRLLSSLCRRGIENNDAQAAMKTVLDEETELAMMSRFEKKYSRKRGEKNSTSLKYLLKSEGYSQNAIERFLSDY